MFEALLMQQSYNLFDLDLEEALFDRFLSANF